MKFPENYAPYDCLKLIHASQKLTQTFWNYPFEFISYSLSFSLPHIFCIYSYIFLSHSPTYTKLHIVCAHEIKIFKINWRTFWWSHIWTVNSIFEHPHTDMTENHIVEIYQQQFYCYFSLHEIVRLLLLQSAVLSRKIRDEWDREKWDERVGEKAWKKTVHKVSKFYAHESWQCKWYYREIDNSTPLVRSIDPMCTNTYPMSLLCSALNI
jgi:hypothetical protein